MTASFVSSRHPFFMSWLAKLSRSQKSGHGTQLSHSDVTELLSAMIRMVDFATKLSLDELTGMLVRKLFFIELTEAVEPYVRRVFRDFALSESEFVCLAGDVAMLSYANSKGHLVGDRLIRTISRELLGVDSLKCFGRPGGDELAGFAHGVYPDAVREQARQAKLRIATKPHRHLDVGVASLRDVQLLLGLQTADGSRLLDTHGVRSKTKFVVDALFAIAMERAQIDKIAFRLHFLALQFLENKEFFDEVKPHAIKSSGGVTMQRIRSLAARLARGDNVWRDCYVLALRSRAKDMSDTPFNQGVHQIARRSLK
jgi:GGDEF domain-containing protein